MSRSADRMGPHDGDGMELPAHPRPVVARAGGEGAHLDSDPDQGGATFFFDAEIGTMGQ